jgi:DNA-binding Lrp family transcriptional regulator
MGRDLDDVDTSILYLLQRDARNKTAQEIGERTGVSASTVRNRIERLEADGIIKGYHPEIDYEAANLPLQLTFVVTVPPARLAEFSEQLRSIHGVVDVREMLTGKRNLHADVVGTSTADVTRITDAVHGLDVQIESSEMLRRRYVQPFNHFFLQGADEDADSDGSGDDATGSEADRVV